MLGKANLRLYKIASIHPEVTHAFPREDQAFDLCDLDFSLDTVPVGVQWDISADAFTFKVSLVKRPFTSQGMLPVLNSQYYPLGLAVPVIVREKFLLRSMMANVSNIQSKSWDKPLAEEQRPTWEAWCKALQALKDFIIDENDIPGAKLPKPIEECTCAVLRRWLLCRGAKTSGKLADLRVRSVLKLNLIILR